jgi:hypothetical protein
MRFFTYWTGGPLSPYERLSLQSFLDHGHEISLYSDLTQETLKPPNGVRVIDAESVVLKSFLNSIRGSDGKHHHALKSDYFRLKKLSLDASEIWVDLDIICLSDDWGVENSLKIGLEDLGVANSAVIGLGDHRELAGQLFERLNDLDLTNIPWGHTGPRLITDQLAVSGLLDTCLPIEAFYPVSYRDIEVLFDPKSSSDISEATSKSKAIHLWSEVISQNRISKLTPPPSKSFLSNLFFKHKIHFEDSEDIMDEKWFLLLSERSKDLDYERTARINLQEANQNLQEANQNLQEANQNLQEANQNLQEANQNLQEANQNLQEANQNLQEANQNLEQTSEMTRVELVRQILEFESAEATSLSMLGEAREEALNLREINKEMTSSKAWKLALVFRKLAHPIIFFRTKIGR